jgi:hypothetical protein
MTSVETLPLCISLLSVVVAFVSYWRTIRLQERMTKAEEAQGRLAERQLLAMDEEAQQATRAHLSVRFQPSGNAHRFVIQNHGPADASAVQMSVTPLAGRLSPLPPSESERLPVAVRRGADAGEDGLDARGAAAALAVRDQFTRPA